MVHSARSCPCVETPARPRRASLRTLAPAEPALEGTAASLRLRKLLLLVVLACPSPLRAQDSTLVRLRHRADSLAREWRQADAVADLVDSLERDRATSWKDTIRVGALRILANPSPLPLREAAARAWPVLDSLYGPEAQALAQRPVIIHAFDPDTTVPRSPLHIGMEVPWNMSAAALTQLLLGNAPMPEPDRPLREWLNGPLRPSWRAAEDRAAVYVQLVTAPSQAVRDCFQGRLEGCAAALDVGASPATLETWYPSAAERRSLLIQSFGDFFNHGATSAALRLCVTGSDSACTGLLRSLPRGVLPRPLGADARFTLVHLALRLGGREAYHRLLVDPAAPVGARLAAAAGMSEDSLVARWRAEILAARPVPVEMPSWAFVIALGWMVFFAGCGLRSSRWRMG